MGLIARIADLAHIGLFFRKMLQGVGLEKFDPLHAGELALMPLHVEFHDLLYDGKQPVVGLVDGVHSNFKTVLPLDLLHKIPSFLPPAGDRRIREARIPSIGGQSILCSER